MSEQKKRSLYAYIKQQLGDLRNEYPNQFWLVMGATFIDRIGGAVLFPFFALYLTDKFDVGLLEVGYVFAIVTVMGIIGSTIGGSLSDQFGRKKLIIFGLISSAMSSLSLILIDDFAVIYAVGAFVGFFTSIGGPAQGAIVADILPEEQHTEGYAMWRVIANLAVTIGPLLGGFIATYSFNVLFIADAVTSVITATILMFALEDTHEANLAEAAAQRAEKEASGEIADTPQPQAGYLFVFRDIAFISFVIINFLMVLVYQQMYQTLPVFLRDEHALPPSAYGYILSMNAFMVVTMQFWISRRLKRYAPLKIMAAGSLLYAIGFGMYGFVSSMVLFLLAMVIITVGEMFVSPTSQAIVAKLAPPDARGRYMAVFGFSWAIPSALALIWAGYLTDNIGPNWVWYTSAILGFIVVFGFMALDRARDIKAPTEEEDQPETPSVENAQPVPTA